MTPALIATVSETSRRLGSLLADLGYLTPQQLEQSLADQIECGGSHLLGEILLERNYCTEEQLSECLALQYGVPYAKLDARLLDPKTIEVLPRDFLERHTILPLFK